VTYAGRKAEKIRDMDLAERQGKHLKNWQTQHKAYDVKPSKRKMDFDDAAAILRSMASDNRRHFAPDTVEALIMGAEALEG